ncbi:MAG: hypothetical protein QOK24_1362 [Verrucomicrobiota bacterium]
MATIEWRAGAAWQVGVFFSSLILGSTGAIALAFRHAAPSPRRILLVVDDLDRCQFDHLLAVVESIKLLIEDHEISRRLQVAVLVEEDVLQHAIWDKYRRLAEPDASKLLRTEYTASRIIRENSEKLFTAHLRLGNLSADEVSDMVSKFARLQAGEMRPLEKTETTPVAASTTPEASEAKVASSIDKGNRGDSVETIPKVVSAAPTLIDAVLGDDEKRAIRDELHEIRDRIRGDLGPRAIRSIMFRYQLARLILDELKIPNWEPAVLVQLLAAKSLWHQDSLPPAATSHPHLWAVVNQVG